MVKYTGHIRDVTFIHPLTKSIFNTDCIYSHHTDGLHENCSKKMILAHIITNSTISIFQKFINMSDSNSIKHM